MPISKRFAAMWRVSAVAASLLTVGAAEARNTQHCEDEVTRHCVEVSCPKFCDVTSSGGSGHEAAVAACKKSCTPEAWCKEVPLHGHGKPDHVELDDENRHELMACIAEEYDPDGSKTGRDTSVPWKESVAATWATKVSAPHDAPAPPPVTPSARGCACDAAASGASSVGAVALFGAAAAALALRRRPRLARIALKSARPRKR